MKNSPDIWRQPSLVRVTAWGLAAGLLLPCGYKPVYAADPVEIEYRSGVVYGTGAGEDLLLDVASPKNLDKPAPAIICIHGGGWQGGKKEDFRPLAERAAQHGYVATTINYRHAPKHVFPAQVEDSKCAVRWMRAHAGELKLDPDRIGAIGGSAGGHLVMMLGAMDKDDGLEGEGGSADQSSKVQAVVAIFGPTNLLSDYPPVSTGILKTFLGGSREEKQDVYRRASPITYVNQGDAPLLIFQGTKDQLVPYDQAVQMATAMTKAGVSGRVELLLGADHGWGGKEMERTIRETLDFFDGHLKK